MRFLKRVNDRGTITLPHEVRQVLGVEEGDIVEMEIVRVIKASDRIVDVTERVESATTTHTPLEA